MGLLAPGFLIGLLAVGLPVWLHLLNRSKHNPQPFSSLMFFERRVKSSAKQRRLRYLLLLAARLAVILLLAFAFASPFLRRESAVAGRRALVVIALDRSFSMHYSNRMQQAKTIAHRVLNDLPGSARVQIVALESQIETLTQPETNRALLNAAIDQVQPGDGASSYGEFARALRSMEQATGMNLDVHLISDMQQTSMPANFRDLQAGPHISLALHPAGERDVPNWAIENAVVPSRIDPANPVRLMATVAGWSTPPATRRVTLLLDGRAIASKEVNVTAGGRASLEFSSFDVPYGVHRGELRLEPHDALIGDDSYFFSIERSDARKVLLLYAANRAREAFYYKAALESGSHSTLLVQSLSMGSAAVHQDFSKYAFVVLSDVGDLDPSLADAICRYVKNGGAALIALGPNTGRAGRIPLSSEHVSEGHQRQTASYVDTGHPALSAAGRLENVQFFDTAYITPKPADRVLARFADNSPLLLEEQMGEGRKLIFASTLDNSANDFALHASFVPFVVQTANYLAGSEENPSSLPVGTSVPLRHTRDQTTAADVIGPDGAHELSLSDATRALNFDLARAGFYEVARADGRRLLEAVHTDRRESDLRSVRDETLELWRNTGREPDTAGRGRAQTQTVRWSFWRYVMAVALAAALLESILANRYLKEGRQAA